MDNISNIGKSISVLDNGYVRLVDVMGSDLSAVNAARVSFAKESLEMSRDDARLINFLAREDHMSPFRHAFATFELEAPLFVARQHWKYVVGSDHTMDAWNEGSRRYITADPKFYIPKSEEWRLAADNKKQGSGGPIDPWTGLVLSEELKKYIEQGESLYNMALNNGVAPEQARLFLAAYGMFVVYRWSCSLQSIALFLNQRLSEDAQYEIQQYAKAIEELITPHFPISISFLINKHV